MKTNSLLALLLFACLAAACCAAPGAPDSKPNIIVILVDDMGFSDIGCYGSEIPTPNIDKLAANGVRFTQFYNTGRCCPSRASLLTGLYPHQAGVGHMTNATDAPGYMGRLNDNCATIAQVLQPAGYFTAMTGKWHVGFEHGVTPANRGFDRSLSAPSGGFYFGSSPRAKLYLNGKDIANEDPILPPNWYSTDLWTEFGVRFIDEAVAAKKPFFLYLAHNAPHFPLQLPKEEIGKFREQYKVGWDQLREERRKRQLDMKLLDPTWALTPLPVEVSPWEKLELAARERFEQIMGIYAGVVAHMDASIGRLTHALEERGLLNNTLILFMSDNGGNAESGPEGKLDGDEPGSAKSTVFCGMSWATLENTPFRRYKHYNHEGGIATPLIVHWPERVTARGEFRNQPGHLIDVMATCVDVSGAKYPAEIDGKAILPMEGKSLVPAFEGKPIEREALYWEHEGNAAVRVGDWKLVRAGSKSPWELYDLRTDRTELHDLAAEKPEMVKDLHANWERWAERTKVVPYPTAKLTGTGKAQ